MKHLDIIKFWFDEIDQKQWWEKDSNFDQHITARFGAVHAKAVRCELVQWRSEPLGRLAEVIVLDQFSRNIYRDQAQAFANDQMALCLAQEAIIKGVPKSLDQVQESFLYMPFMHSESASIHETAVELFTQCGLESSLKFQFKHKEIIDRFGRYPHRNKILGRDSTLEEIAFLSSPDSSF